MTWSNQSILLIFFFLFGLVHTFILQVNTGHKKCFRSLHSHEKTIDIRFSFPMPNRAHCEIQFDVSLKSEAHQENIHRGSYQCLNFKSEEPFVIKHNKQINNQEQGLKYSESYYHICLQVLQNKNPTNLLVQLKMNDHYKTYEGFQSEAELPLVLSSQLQSLEQIVRQIHSGVFWNFNHLVQARKQGLLLDTAIDDAAKVSRYTTYIEVLFLILYGAAWVYFIRNFKK